MHEPTRLANVATRGTGIRLEWPSETLKPANSIVASLGIGMHALSSSMSTNTPASPRSPTTFVAKQTSGAVRDADQRVGDRRQREQVDQHEPSEGSDYRATGGARVDHVVHGPDRLAEIP